MTTWLPNKIIMLSSWIWSENISFKEFHCIHERHFLSLLMVFLLMTRRSFHFKRHFSIDVLLIKLFSEDLETFPSFVIMKIC